MTRQYWTGHAHQHGLIDDNRHIAMLIIRNFEQAEVRLMDYEPYRRWKQWLNDQPKQKGGG